MLRYIYIAWLLLSRICLVIIKTRARVSEMLLHSSVMFPSKSEQKMTPEPNQKPGKNPRSGMGVVSLLNDRPFPSAQNRAKPGSVKAALAFVDGVQLKNRVEIPPQWKTASMKSWTCLRSSGSFLLTMRRQLWKVVMTRHLQWNLNYI